MQGKSDMDRVALFQEMGYHTVGDPYVSKAMLSFNDSGTKGRQMFPGGEKTKSALPAGYFAEFGRILEGESYSDPVKLRMEWRKKENAKIIGGKPFYPSQGSKLPSGIGSHYGTFSGMLSHFEAIGSNPDAPFKGKNFITNPPKKGSGYGYPNVFIGKLPDYQNEPYEVARELARKELEEHKKKLDGRGEFKISTHGKEFFDNNPYAGPTEKFNLPPIKSSTSNPAIFRPSNPGKSPGGNKSGCFDQFPTYSSDPYISSKSIYQQGAKSGRAITDKKFMPSSGNKSPPTKSILTNSVIHSINRNNYKSVTQVSTY
jgi:hypothetical protein